MSFLHIIKYSILKGKIIFQAILFSSPHIGFGDCGRASVNWGLMNEFFKTNFSHKKQGMFFEHIDTYSRSIPVI